jgi:type 1 glutamine amidotransferase
LLAGAYAVGAAGAANPRILVFTKTAGFRHDSIPAAIQAVRDLGAKNGFDVTATEDDTVFSASGLAPYEAVVFLLTTGDVLSDPEQAAFEAWFRAGHGYVGVHSAADTERDWPWYGRLVGAWSSGHPEIQTATMDVLTPRDASTAGLPARWTRTDEWYGWLADPRTNGVRVLVTVDETTYEPRDWAMGAGHPITWEHELDGGRAWYTENGHTDESYADPLFLGELLGGIRYALARPAAEPEAASPGRLVAPAMRSLSLVVRNRRIAVSFRAVNCVRCAAKLLVRSSTTKLRLVAGVASGSTAVLPAGRWRVTVVLTEQASGLSATTRRWVRIPTRRARRDTPAGRAAAAS